MTEIEMSKILYTIQASYPRHFKLSAPEMADMVKAWLFTLGEYSYSDVSAGLKVYLSTDRTGFPPSPGQIINGITRLHTSPERELTAAEAWAITYKAICSMRWECPEEEFYKLPKACQRTIGTPAAMAEIAMMDTDSVLIGEKARFIRQYDQIAKNEKEYAALPPSVREMIEHTTAGMIGEKEGREEHNAGSDRSALLYLRSED